METICRTRRVLSSLTAALLLGSCNAPSPPAPAAPAAPAVTAVLNLKQLMEWVLDPTADVVWDSVKTIYTQAGTKEIKPETEEQWNAVRYAAATLTEAGNMLMAQGRPKGGAEWAAAAQRLVTAADKTLKAAEAKNVNAIFETGGEIYVACRSCHQKFAPHLQAGGP
jgi:cytochrome c556